MQMLRSSLVRAVLVFAAAAASACSDSNSPASPSDSSLTGSVTAPRAAQPAANASVRFADQPVILAVQNAVVTRSSGTVYTFEVATDASFASKVQTKENVAENTSGQTSVQLDALGGGRDYFWRARATGGGTTGPFSAATKFTVGPAVVISTPTPIAPLNNTTTSPRPALRVTNVTRSGPAGAITYFFEIANSSAFTTVLASATRPEGINETGFIPTSDLPSNITLYWRATAIDASSGVRSASSSVQSFTARQFSQAEALAAQLGFVLFPGAQPPGTTGHATMGTNWEIQTLYYAPRNIFFPSPEIDALRFFDVVDRGMDPESAVAWLKSNGYVDTEMLWYPGPEKAVLGLRYVYIAARNKVIVNGTWDIVVRVE